MSFYKNCDIIMCFPGIGRTFFAEEVFRYSDGTSKMPHSDFTLDKDFKLDKEFKGDSAAKFAIEVSAIRTSRKYRYILIPLRYDIASALHDRNIPFIIVKPYEQDRDAWMKRWMKAGETAASIEERRVEMNNSEIGYSAFAPIALSAVVSTAIAQSGPPAGSPPSRYRTPESAVRVAW
ncbi:MAG: hypothetical protein EOL87_18985, partial [Spartobacteria bacterium]|nr:hypothetical protein [Spartobacteria bacterium]